MNPTLQKKVDRAVKLIKSASGNDVVEVCYSGGKDSDVILELAKMAGIKYRAIYKNTTIDPPGTIKHAIEMGAEIIRPKKSFLQLVSEKGLPTRRARFCCEKLKEYKVLDKAIQGIRTCESSARSKRYNEENPVICRIYGSKKNHVNVILPILSWTDDDVKEFIEERGIKCQVFNPFRPFISIVLNNRDHRKIMVVDGHTGFTGGINLADEYINKKMRFGHWKDTGIRIKGDAVWNFTVMFLQMWCSITNDTRDLDPGSAKAFSPDRYSEHKESDDGYVQPYGDSPLDEETVGENVYLQMIAHAKKYIYIFTPYLIIDNEMMTALCLAAKSGLDVRIVTPGIPDKRIVFWLSRSYYEQLIQSGVRIYEYNPGFIHAKSFLCDDEVAAVGTINLDYRSLYLHFECGVWMYDSHAVMELKEDVMQTLEMSTQITLAEVRSWKLPVRMMQSLLRLMAPML